MRTREAPLSQERLGCRAPPAGQWGRGPGRELVAGRGEAPNRRGGGGARRTRGCAEGGSAHRRALARRATQARTPPRRRRPTLGLSAGRAGAQEAGGAVAALPLPRLPVSALGRGRFVGFGLSGSRSAGETAGDPAAAAAGVRLGHARCQGLSPSMPSNMKDSGDSKDQQLMVRPHHPSFSTPSVAQTLGWP